MPRLRLAINIVISYRDKTQDLNILLFDNHATEQSSQSITGPERRQTKFSGNASTIILSAKTAEQEPDVYRLSGSRIPQVSDCFQFFSCSRFSALPLKVNSDFYQFSATSLSKRVYKVCCNRNPWTEYYSLFSILKNNKIGKIIVIYRNKYQHSIVVIKKITVINIQSPRRLTVCSYKNIVSFYNYYLHKNSLFILYK